MNLEELDKLYLWHPYTQMQEMLDRKIRIIERAEGFYLIDTEGNRYIDGAASMWCNVWGHTKKELVDVMKEQLDKLQHSSLFGLSNDKAILLAERLCKLTNMDKVFYASDGSSAIEVAIKMAIQYWKNNGEKRNKIVALKNGYHGDTIGSMSVGYVEQFFSNYKQLLFNVKHVESPYLFRKSKDMQDQDYINYCLDLIESELKDQDAACVIMESGAQLAGGAIIYPPNYQHTISKLCKEYDSLLILDEIATGFGRLGNMVEFIAQESEPDIVTFGKMLTAGYMPLSVTLTTNKIYDEFLGDYYDNKQLFHGHTYTGHPLACVIALTNIDLYKRYNLIDNIKEKSRIIEDRVKEFDSKIIGDIRHKGMAVGIELVKENSKEPLRLKRAINHVIMEEAFKRGAYIRPLANIIMIMPPLAIDNDTLNRLLDITDDVIKTIEKMV